MTSILIDRALKFAFGACFLAALSLASAQTQAQSLIWGGLTEPTTPSYAMGVPSSWQGRRISSRTVSSRPSIPPVLIEQPLKVAAYAPTGQRRGLHRRRGYIIELPGQA